MTEQSTKVESFRRLHDGARLLVLANCWDAGSARLIESIGASALATTSAGVAWSLGYPDGDTLPQEVLLTTIRSIYRVVQLPLSVDLEGGYSSDPASVGALAKAIAEAGAVGINLEDGAGSAELLAAKIRAIRASLASAGCGLFINARTDVYLRGLVPPADRVRETLARAELYRSAGADGLFVPKVTEPVEIGRLVAGAGLPLNVLATPGLPAAAELARLGVRRLSAGSGVAQTIWSLAASTARAFLEEGRSEPLSNTSMTYPMINALFSAKR